MLELDIGTYEREIKKSRVFFGSHKEREIRAGWIIFYYYFMIIIGTIIFCNDSFHWNLMNLANELVDFNDLKSSNMKHHVRDELRSVN